MLVELNEGEMRLAIQAGVDRRLTAIRLQSGEVYGKASRGDYWTIDIEAAAAEMAAAKALGVFWAPAASAAQDRLDGDLPGGIQIRHTSYPTGRLIVHDRDDDDHVFVLVIGTMPHFKVVGWIRGEDAKDEMFWDTKVPRPAFFVPQDHLLPLEQLG